MEKLKVHRDTEKLGLNDLLFAVRNQGNPKPTLRLAPDPNKLGLTEPNEKGRQYKHGTLSGYGVGKCRCERCQAACAVYRARRRAQGKDNPRTPRIRQTDDDGHIFNDWFRRHYRAVSPLPCRRPTKPRWMHFLVSVATPRSKRRNQSTTSRVARARNTGPASRLATSSYRSSSVQSFVRSSMARVISARAWAPCTADPDCLS